jgi:hypothetical protein
MSERTLQQLSQFSRRIRRSASRAYIEQRATLRKADWRPYETDREVREAMRGWLAAESAS